MFRVKICGITSPADAEEAVRAGADAIGINFYPGSPRCVSWEQAAEISAAVAGQALVVGVFVDEPRARLEAAVARTGLHAVQLHGNESPGDLAELPVPAIKAFRLGHITPSHIRDFVQIANRDGLTCGAILVDSYLPGVPGGSGALADWSAACQVATMVQSVPMILAGGLTADLVAAAVKRVAPFGVDVASGVESAPGQKSRAATA